MKDLRSKILNAISKGLNESLNYIEDLGDDDFSLSKKCVSQAIKDNSNLKSYYSNKLQDMLPEPMDINNEFMHQALEWHKKYGAQYNPHLDGELFRKFIISCRIIIGNVGDYNWIDTSEVTNMDMLFFSFNYFNGDITKWDVSHVENMDGLFQYCHSFNQDLSQWDVSRVKQMNEMFDGCNSFEGIGLENWDISNVQQMWQMFGNCSKFNRDISSWNISNVKNVGYMFYNCLTFNQDLSSWNLSGIKRKEAMFMSCPSMEYTHYPVGLK